MTQEFGSITTTDWTAGQMAFDPSPVLKNYLLDHTSGFTPVIRRLYDKTVALGDPSVMMLGHEQVAFFQLLVKLMGARRVLDLGTFTGISTLAFASALKDGGQVVTVDRNSAWIDFAKPFWEEAGVIDQIEARVGEVNQILARMQDNNEEPFDIIFIDVDKANTALYVRESFKLLSPGGVILVDNALWHGWVLDTEMSDVDTVGMRSFNRQILADATIDVSMLPLGDGLTILRRHDKEKTDANQR
ncbi:MAG: O-methyltransferase [marine bacterium B5-7]|nr:MAG: O-methyltransferase [marine bacterium B5-7]